jgi:hypothetical protein
MDEGTDPADDRTRERERLIEDIACLLARWLDRRRPREGSSPGPVGDPGRRGEGP